MTSTSYCLGGLGDQRVLAVECGVAQLVFDCAVTGASFLVYVRGRWTSPGLGTTALVQRDPSTSSPRGSVQAVKSVAEAVRHHHPPFNLYWFDLLNAF